MLVLGRGHTTFTEVPDVPTPPTPPAVSLVGRGSEAPAAPSADVSHAPQAITTSVTPSFTATDTTPVFSPGTTPVFSAGPALSQSGAPLLLSPVASVVTDIQTPTSLARGADAPTSGGGDGEVGRGGDSIAPMLVAMADYADNGWFIVPSAANEYGESYASGD